MISDITSQEFRDFNKDVLTDLIPNDMVVPILRLKFSIQNLSWLCRNLQIRNNEHPEIKQTMAKLNMLRNKILLGKAEEVPVLSEPPAYPISLGDLHV
jgi:hypothetical protein|tara:strand:+ start:164 stop:457 length:294 start_codon:yes stop_codon:yes gene_type:complete